MLQRCICANIDGKFWAIAELKGHKVNMFCKENCLFSLRELVKGIPTRAEFAPENFEYFGEYHYQSWKPFSVNMSESGRYQFDACNIRLIPGTSLQGYSIDSCGALNHINYWKGNHLLHTIQNIPRTVHTCCVVVYCVLVPVYFGYILQGCFIDIGGQSYDCLSASWAALKTMGI